MSLKRRSVQDKKAARKDKKKKVFDLRNKQDANWLRERRKSRKKKK